MVMEPIVWRRSIREYSQEPVLDESLIDVVKAAQFAPTAMDNRGVEFIIIKKAGVKKELAQALGQDFIKDAPAVIVPFIADKKSPLPESDLAIASAFIMIQAASLGMGTAWKHVPAETKEAVRKILEIPATHIFINAVPVGYPLNDLPDHGDADFDARKVHIDKF